MKVTFLLAKVLIGLCLASLLFSTSCCVAKAFEDDDDPYVQDLLPPQ